MPKQDIAKALNNAIKLQNQILDTYKKLWAENDTELEIIKNAKGITNLTVKALEEQFDLLLRGNEQ
jgi:lipid-binding SYLF domain-containing protein